MTGGFMDNLERDLKSIQSAEEVRRVAGRKFMDDARAYVAAHVPAAMERVAYLESFFRTVANPFVAKIQRSPAGKDPEIGKLLFAIKSFANVIGQLQIKIGQCQRISDAELLQWRHCWKAYVDSNYVGKLNPGNVEGTVRLMMGQVTTLIERMATSVTSTQG
jgi:hypothetical protein